MRLRLAALLLLLLAAGARADPTISTPAPRQGLAVWTFSNAADYTLDNVTIGAGGVSLAWQSRAASDTTESDFAAALAAVNVDTGSSPGDVRILNTSQSGPPAVLSRQPGPAQLEDNYLWSGGGSNTNFGASPNLMVGYWGNPEWNRPILRFPSFPLPANATVLDARLRLFLHTADTPEAMDLSVHRMTTAWTELSSTWNDYDGSNPWNASGGGGDLDAVAVDVIPGVTTNLGWYEWNVTSLVEGWWSGTILNQGLLLRQINDDQRVSLGRKQFYSSDATNASARPTLVLTYTAPGSSTGLLESRPLDAGGVAVWRSIAWNASTPSDTTVSVQTRTGGAVPPDGTWSPWSSPYPVPGLPVASPPGRYLQYRALLATSSGTSPTLREVTATFERYGATGSVETKSLDPADLLAWGRLALDATTPAGTSVALAYSQDGGTTWTPTANGADLAPASSQSLLLRVVLSTTDTTVTPRVHALSLGFALTPQGGGGGGFQIPVIAGIPVWVLLIPLGVLAAWAIGKDLRRPPFDATDVFLIHEDGRLIHRVGGEESPVADELAVSGMFTIVAQFVKDSFGGADGQGELKNFQVDDREVAVGRAGYLFLALVGRGTPPPELPRNLAWFLRGVGSAHRRTIQRWDGLSERLGDIPGALAWFLRRGYRRRFLWPRHEYRCG